MCAVVLNFVLRRSTVTNLLQCDAAIVQHLNNSRPCDVITLDFSRAFDKVSHSVLSKKLANVGVCGKLHAWLTNFIARRSQYVSFHGEESLPAPVTSGVIQGSVIGPHLFVLVINDLPSCTKSSDIWLFADDVKFVSVADSPEACASTQSDLNAVEVWSATNELPLCLPKSQCMHLGQGNANHTYVLGGSPVPVVDQLTDLGLLRTSDNTYAAHVERIVKKASRSAAMMFRVFSTRNSAFLVKLFKAYIRPQLEYASPVWSPAGIGLSSDIESVQRRFTKRLPNLRYVCYEDRLAQLRLETLEARRLHADLLSVFKLLHGMLDINPSSVGVVLSTAPTRGQGINLVVHRANSCSVGYSFSFRVAKSWNNLPPAIKAATSLGIFKKLLIPISPESAS
jgi:ribonucleases P/MRP protein subunit RPP40